MKSALILVAIALSLVLGLAMGMTLSGATGHAGVYDPGDQIRVRQEFPGGKFIRGDTVYELCDHGFKVHLYPDGGKDYLRRPCWK